MFSFARRSQFLEDNAVFWMPRIPVYDPIIADNPINSDWVNKSHTFIEVFFNQ
jgi:hypothetical protein